MFCAIYCIRKLRQIGRGVVPTLPILAVFRRFYLARKRAQDAQTLALPILATRGRGSCGLATGVAEMMHLSSMVLKESTMKWSLTKQPS